jgi:hypothetical protein
MAKIPQDVLKKIGIDSSRILKPEFEKKILRNFELVKNEMIKEFLNHPVTEEIKNGPNTENISGTLGGIGNLFSYIGFTVGEDPVEPILDEFKKTTIRFNGLIDGGANWLIFMPAKEDIWAVSQMPWAPGRSWAKGIESGISGVGQYLYNPEAQFDNSRSGTAVQTSSKLRRKTRFKNVKYISLILAKYEQKFSELNETSIFT